MNDKEPALFIECPDCDGDGIERCTNPDHGFISAMPGEINRLGCPACGHDPEHKTGEKCPKCNGTGEIPNYLTPEQYEEQTGRKMLDSDSAWAIYIGERENPITTRRWFKCDYGKMKETKVYTLIVARPGQPKPPADWRP